jgi:hypothetical protein
MPGRNQREFLAAMQGDQCSLGRQAAAHQSSTLPQHAMCAPRMYRVHRFTILKMIENRRSPRCSGLADGECHNRYSAREPLHEAAAGLATPVSASS